MNRLVRLTLVAGLLALTHADATRAAAPGISLASVTADGGIVAVPDGLAFTQTPLMAGQTTVAGRVVAYNTATQLVVQYETSNGWVIGATHLDLGLQLRDIAQNRSGNPIPGRFAYRNTFSPSATRVQYVFDLSGEARVDFQTLLVAAHAELSLMNGDRCERTETGWGAGLRFPGRNWAMYFGHIVQCTTSPIDCIA